MNGHNQVWISGNIGGKFVFGKTRDEQAACSFSIATDSSGRRRTWVRVNAYGQLAFLCQKMLTKGVYCSVIGELMNRDGQYGELTEIRAKEIVFSSPPPQREYDDEQEPPGPEAAPEE